MLPAEGCVLGIDVGWDPKKATTSLCLLSWDAREVSISTRRIGSDEGERRAAVRAMCANRHTLVAAIDGPLTDGLRVIGTYRSAEAILSRGALQKRGKPGQTSSPVGQQLHRHATQLASLAVQEASIATAVHPERIHDLAIVEAFPNTFLGALIPEVNLPPLKRDASDRYWETCITLGLLDRLLSLLLPERLLAQPLSTITNHDDRAGVVCGLTALSVARAGYVAVGDPRDGWIILPPSESWVSLDGTEPWMLRELRQNTVVLLDEYQRGRALFSGAPQFSVHPLAG